MDRAQQIRAWGAGLLLLATAFSGQMAWAHARMASALGVICGETPAAHCPWCPLALVSGLAGLLLLRAWNQGRLTPAPARVKARSNPSR